jgi:hypothetical protein
VRQPRRGPALCGHQSRPDSSRQLVEHVAACGCQYTVTHAELQIRIDYPKGSMDPVPAGPLVAALSAPYWDPTHTSLARRSMSGPRRSPRIAPPVYPPKTPVHGRQSVTSGNHRLLASEQVNGRFRQSMTSPRPSRSVTRGRGFESRRPDQVGISAGQRPAGPAITSTSMDYPSSMPLLEPFTRGLAKLVLGFERLTPVDTWAVRVGDAGGWTP